MDNSKRLAAADEFVAALDARREVGEAITRFEFLEARLTSELLGLEKTSGSTCAKVKCISELRALRMERIRLLGNAGLLDASAMQARTRLPSAAEIREHVRRLERIKNEDLYVVSEAERPSRALTHEVGSSDSPQAPPGFVEEEQASRKQSL